jgi:hypothetical protein
MDMKFMWGRRIVGILMFVILFGTFVYAWRIRTPREYSVSIILVLSVMGTVSCSLFAGIRAATNKSYSRLSSIVLMGGAAVCALIPIISIRPYPEYMLMLTIALLVALGIDRFILERHDEAQEFLNHQT